MELPCNYCLSRGWLSKGYQAITMQPSDSCSTQHTLVGSLCEQIQYNGTALQLLPEQIEAGYSKDSKQ
jgi:hypothetical protein